MQKSVSLKQRLIKGAVGSFGLKIVSTGLAFLLNLLMARALGSEGLGTYALAITWIGLLGLPAKLGFPTLLVRDVSVYYAQQNWRSMNGLIRRSYQLSFLISVVLAIAAAYCVWLLGNSNQILTTLLIAFIALPLSTIRKLNQSTMSGLKKVVRGQLAESLIAPFLMLLLTGWLYFNQGDRITPMLLIGCYVAVTGITMLFGFFQLNQIFPKAAMTAIPDYQTWTWVKTAIPFMALGALYLVQSQTDMVMLGVMDSSRSVGLYVVANRLASLVIFILLASNTALSPNISSLYVEGKFKQLGRIVTRAARAVFLISCLVALGLYLAKNFLLGLFGSEFSGSDSILLILVAGQLVNAFVGPADVLLTLTGHEKLFLNIFSLSAVVNIVLNFLLIPMYGTQGAAVATATSMVFSNVINTIFVKKFLGLNSTALGSLKV